MTLVSGSANIRTRMTRTGLTMTLRRLIRKMGSQQAAAEHLGVSGAYLSDILHRKRDPGPKVLEVLGLREVKIYVPEGRSGHPRD